MTAAAPEVSWRRRLARVGGVWPGFGGGGLDSRRAAWAWLILVTAAAVAAPSLVSVLGLPGPTARDGSALNLFSQPTGPSAAHPFGVDGQGRDVLSRALYGLRSLVWTTALAVLAAAVASRTAARAVAVAGRAGPSAAGRVGPPGATGPSGAAAAGGPGARFAASARLAGASLDALLAALGAFPPLALGLGLGLALGPGPWRMPLAVALALVPRARRWSAPALAAEAVGLGVALTFLGDGPGGSAPQLGAMIARAGTGMLAGIPAWWELAGPGGLAALVIVGLTALGGRRPVLGRQDVGLGTRRVRGLGTGIELALLVGLSRLLLPGLGGADRGGTLSGLGAALGPTGSLLLGAGAVWGLVTGAGIRRLGARRRAPSRSVGRSLGPLGFLATLLAAAPLGWLGYLTLYGFSDSVGRLPLLPGAGTYVAPSSDVGRWAQALVLPWLVIGLPLAAASLRAASRKVATVRAAAQQRVARAAGVPEAGLAAQRRRTLAAAVLADLDDRVGWALGAVVLVEVTFRIPGAGAWLASAFQRGRSAGLADLTFLAGLAALLARVGIAAMGRRLDPGGGR